MPFLCESNPWNFQERKDKSTFLIRFIYAKGLGQSHSWSRLGIRDLELLATRYLFCSRQLWKFIFDSWRLKANFDSWPEGTFLFKLISSYSNVSSWRWWNVVPNNPEVSVHPHLWLWDLNSSSTITKKNFYSWVKFSHFQSINQRALTEHSNDIDTRSERILPSDN